MFWLHAFYFLGGRESAAKYNSAVAAGALSFRLYYSIVFDDSPRAQCQQASAGRGLAGGGGIYCRGAGVGSGGGLTRLLVNLQQHLRTTAFQQLPGLGDIHALLPVWFHV